MKRRAEVIDSVREVASGGDSSSQLAAELHSLSQHDREDLLHQVQLPLVIPTEHALPDLAIPWIKLRILRRLSTQF